MSDPNFAKNVIEAGAEFSQKVNISYQLFGWFFFRIYELNCFNVPEFYLVKCAKLAVAQNEISFDPIC